MNIKKGLIIFAWVSIIGSFGDGFIGLYGLILVFVDPVVTFTISVEELIKDHINFLYWVKNIAYLVLPKNVVAWVFSMPALVYFPARVITSLFIGYYVLKFARRM